MKSMMRLRNTIVWITFMALIFVFVVGCHIADEITIERVRHLAELEPSEQRIYGAIAETSGAIWWTGMMSSFASCIVVIWGTKEVSVAYQQLVRQTKETRQAELRYQHWIKERQAS